MKVEFHESFTKRFVRLSPKVQESFYTRLDLFRQDKFFSLLRNHAVHGKYEGLRSINVTGDYRALFEDHRELVIFKLIGTHSELYE